MKILVIHNFHRKGSASGDDQVFKSETALLEKYGNTVVRYTVSNDKFDNFGIIGKIISAFGMLWSFRYYKDIKKIIKEQKPDIVHVHTFFPLLSPSILYAVKRSGIKLVATLHDTRLICPCATSLRGQNLCNLCGDGHYFRMCKYSCFKQSKLQSFIVACIFMYHRKRKTFYDQIDKYVCLNENQIKLLKGIGFNENKIVKKYNFVPDLNKNVTTLEANGFPTKYVAFFGRIGEEKGIYTLMDIWDRLCDIPLVVMGGGPLEKEFREWSTRKENVYYLGYTEHEKCLSIVKSAEFVVFPSIWYEGCSMVEIETESLGIALVATDLGFSEEAIQNGFNGYKVNLGDIDGFVKIIKQLWSNSELCKDMGINARKDYEMKYTPDNNYQQLMRIYMSLIQSTI